jgi:hypothetical protein
VKRPALTGTRRKMLLGSRLELHERKLFWTKSGPESRLKQLGVAQVSWDGLLMLV